VAVPAGAECGAVGKDVIVTIRGDESDRARKRDHVQAVRTFLDFHFPGATRREFSTGGSHIFRLKATAPPDPELVVSDEVLEDPGTVPYLDQETADALKRGARVLLTHNGRRISERTPPEGP
jgi:hypothetical protein